MNSAWGVWRYAIIGLAELPRRARPFSPGCCFRRIPTTRHHAFANLASIGRRATAGTIQLRASLSRDGEAKTQGGDLMTDHVLDAMRDLREELRQRLLQVPEYRALMALDRSIKEICDILEMRPAPVDEAPEAETPRRPAAGNVEPLPSTPPRSNAIASAFAET